MVKTGYISFISETGGTQDGSGNHVATTKTASAFIDCNSQVITKEYKTVIDGDYQQASYSIYINQDLFSGLAISLENIKNVSIKDNNGNALGIFRIHNREYLNITKRIKIVI